MQSAYLPNSLRPFVANHMLRMGSSTDGGYVLDMAAVRASKFLLSCGVNEDWSFEEQFYSVDGIV